MSRRVLAVLAVCCIAALSVTAVAFAHGGGGKDGSSGKSHHHQRRAHAKPPADFVARGLFAASLDSLAQRLSVEPAALRTAVKAVVREQRAKKHHKAKPDLAALKTELATSLATKLGKTPDEVLTAVRAELDARLTQAVQAGWLTQKGHDLALACFDDPNACDMKALKGEVCLFGHKHDKPSSDDQGTTSAPSSTMTPGGRATSTPLR